MADSLIREACYMISVPLFKSVFTVRLHLVTIYKDDI